MYEEPNPLIRNDFLERVGGSQNPTTIPKTSEPFFLPTIVLGEISCFHHRSPEITIRAHPHSTTD